MQEQGLVEWQLPHRRSSWESADSGGEMICEMEKEWDMSRVPVSEKSGGAVTVAPAGTDASCDGRDVA